MMVKKNRSAAPVVWRVLAVACFALAGVCLVQAAPWSRGGSSARPGMRATALPAQAQLASGTTTAGRLTKSIEQIQVGERVAGRNPQVSDEQRAEAEPIVPAEWRKLTLEMVKPDGTVLDIALLRPAAWVEENAAQAGEMVELDLPELGAEGPARVMTIEPCPAVRASANGRVVTGTFRHLVSSVLDLWVEGQSAPIGVTANHPIWSEDRQDFVRADQLQPGERLAGLDGDARVASISLRGGQQQVYNLEVDLEHVYLVSQDGLLVHNSAYGKGRETLTRYASGKESVGRLSRMAQESLKNPLEQIHGVSVTAGPPAREGAQVARDIVEQHFPVHNTPTPANPLHRTVELPDPVTKEIADLWNSLWGFAKK